MINKTENSVLYENMLKTLAQQFKDIKEEAESPQDKRLLCMVQAVLLCAHYAVFRFNKDSIVPSMDLVKLCSDYLSLAEIELDSIQEEDKFKQLLLDNKVFGE